jgi:hypothetical protein
MMKKARLTLLLVSVLSGASLAQFNFMWQTTHGAPPGHGSTGPCRLVSEKIRITVYPFFVELEEEAVLAPVGSVGNGDSSTLELFGDFALTRGAALRSFLLWEGGNILKAKLVDRVAADSAYEAIVDRSNPQPARRDPAEIAYRGNNTYHFRIYPVAINGSRKIRVLYSMPYTIYAMGPEFTINSVFTMGACQSSTQVPVEIRKAPGVPGNYLISYGSVKETIEFGATYQVETGALHGFSGWGYDESGNWTFRKVNPLSILPDSAFGGVAFAATVDSGPTQGHYTAVFAAPPDTVLAVLREYSTSPQLCLHMDINAGGRLYSGDFERFDRYNGFVYDGYAGMYVKSAEAWDSTVTWRVFISKMGSSIFDCKVKFSPQSDSTVKRILPLIWAAKYSLVEESGNLGALFGFVDRRMALLAREQDALGASDKALYEESGVPPLTPGDILVKASDIPPAPQDNVILEKETGVLKVAPCVKPSFSIAVKSNRRVALSFNARMTAPIKAMLYDVSGRLLETWNDVRLSGGLEAELSLPASANGCLLLKVLAEKETMQKKFTVTR